MLPSEWSMRWVSGVSSQEGMLLQVSSSVIAHASVMVSRKFMNRCSVCSLRISTREVFMNKTQIPLSKQECWKYFFSIEALSKLISHRWPLGRGSLVLDEGVFNYRVVHCQSLVKHRWFSITVCPIERQCANLQMATKPALYFPSWSPVQLMMCSHQVALA